MKSSVEVLEVSRSVAKWYLCSLIESLERAGGACWDPECPGRASLRSAVRSSVGTQRAECQEETSAEDTRLILLCRKPRVTGGAAGNQLFPCYLPPGHSTGRRGTVAVPAGGTRPRPLPALSDGELAGGCCLCGQRSAGAEEGL